jgi:hypothetical protein
MATVTEYVGTDFDLFEKKPVQMGILETIETWYNPTVSMGRSDLEFLIPGDSETYVDLYIRLFVRGKLTTPDGTDLETTDHTALTNNCLHSLFSQRNISLNDVSVTQTSDLYNYRAYLEILLSYGTDASRTHLTNSYWYLDDPELGPCDPTEANAKNRGFVER